MARVRFAWLSSLPALAKYVQESENENQFRFMQYTFAYVSLRVEGKVQISIEALEQRLNIIDYVRRSLAPQEFFVFETLEAGLRPTPTLGTVVTGRCLLLCRCVMLTAVCGWACRSYRLRHSLGTRSAWQRCCRSHT